MPKLIDIKLLKAQVLIEETFEDDFAEWMKQDDVYEEYHTSGFQFAWLFKNDIYKFLDSKNYEWNYKRKGVKKWQKINKSIKYK